MSEISMMQQPARTAPIEISVDHGGFVYVDGERTGAHLTKMQERFLRLVLSSTGVLSREFAMSALYYNINDEP